MKKVIWMGKEATCDRCEKKATVFNAWGWFCTQCWSPKKR